MLRRAFRMLYQMVRPASPASALAAREPQAKQPPPERATRWLTPEQAQDAMRVAAGIAHRRPDLVAGTAIQTLTAMIADIDAQLSAQMNEILHQPELQSVEGAWRGLFHLVSTIGPGTCTVIRVLNIDKAALSAALPQGSDGSHSPIAALLLDRIYQERGAAPVAVLVLDAYLVDSEQDAAMTASLSQICARGQMALLTGIAPARYTAKDFATAPEFTSPGWTSLRAQDSSRYIGLCLPRCLARRPYSDDTAPVAAFAFEERATSGTASDHLWFNTPDHLWFNAAYAMAANIGRAMNAYGWPVRCRGVDGGGAVPGLPNYTLSGTDQPDNVRPPVEIVIGERQESRLAKAGFIGLVNKKGTGRVAVLGAQSFQDMPVRDGTEDPDQIAMKSVLTRLPYLLCICRYAQYAMRMAADWPQSLTDPESAAFQAHVHSWLDAAVHPRPWDLKPEDRAARPLQQATFTLLSRQPHQQPRAELYMIPGYQLEGLGIGISLTMILPAGPGGRPDSRSFHTGPGPIDQS